MTRITNLDRLNRKLKQLPAIAREMIRAEMAKAADEIVGMMKRLAPVLAVPVKDRRSGALRDSIGWTWGSAPKGSAVVATVASKSGDMAITIYAGNAEAYYARWVEFGTQKMRAQPYFYVSWRANKRRTVRRLGKAVRDAAKKVAAS
ncbi:HK97 gp10 family phage protein [Rhizobium sp. ERR 1071]|uniref:HK97-gp10 family putative phage morphogenesis protein n=1 Tax=Rhizobium sp. ERR 1071 TaxID=2572677 RepID=UPI001199CF63|nr:HK97-gp10 family putative phage morphogenesis protein [Rhizobium sp. ERR1071]TWB20044.1 HK97 gp10 family phage protein [Rhizobium sp. ERR1071]